jgi:uncharacterized membrane protein (UPF0127 family)
MVTQTRVFKAIVILLSIGALLVLFVRFGVPEKKDGGVVINGTLRTEKSVIPVRIVDTEKERTQGLSGTVSLPEGQGMVFIFDNPAPYGFWMKDMRYSIDIVWIDASFRVVGVTESVSPLSYPETFFAPVQVQYVLEMNSGDARRYGLAPGVAVLISKNK